MTDPRSKALRRRLVRELEERGAIRSAPVRAAFLSVPRDLFIPEVVSRSGIDAAYRDEAFPTKFSSRGEPISSSSQPAIMAEMLERLAVVPGMRVLEVGAGTGYNAALLSELVGTGGRVDTIDIDEDTSRRARRALRAAGVRARVLVGDGRDGWADGAPYDRIVVTASSETVPRAWFDQLVDGGIVEVPLRLRDGAGAHVVASLQKSESGLRSVSIVPGGFMPLRDGGEAPLPRGMCSLAMTDLTGDAPRPIRQITGPALARLSEPAKRRLLSISLDAPRRRALGLRADGDSLVLYLSTTLPPGLAVTVLPEWGVGVVSRDGRSLAYVACRGPDGRRTVARLAAHGDAAAETRLATAVAAWTELGRPGPERFRVEVAYDGTRPLLRSHW